MSSWRLKGFSILFPQLYYHILYFQVYKGEKFHASGVVDIVLVTKTKRMSRIIAPMEISFNHFVIGGLEKKKLAQQPMEL